jgi:hypothetical protein
MKAFAGKFKPTCSLAGVIASSARQQGNTPTPFAKKWTDDEWHLRRLIGIDNLPRCQMSKIEERTTASMDVVLEEVCRSLPHNGDHQSRKYVAHPHLQLIELCENRIVVNWATRLRRDSQKNGPHWGGHSLSVSRPSNGDAW